MKKVFLFSFGLLAAISSLLVSCEEAVGDDDAPISVGGVLDPNGHEYVDLGLPSGIKWATCNVGATEPWEYGGYYAWGETEEKNKYDWNTYKWGYLINVATSSQSEFVTKYCVDNEYNDGKGIFDNKIILDLEDDVAYLKWGGEWRIPTLKEQKELEKKKIRDNYALYLRYVFPEYIITPFHALLCNIVQSVIEKVENGEKVRVCKKCNAKLK